MKIIQLNIWGGKLGYQIIDFLNAEKPDFVCMQEVQDLKGMSGALFATLDEIREFTGFEEVFMSSNYAFRYMERELEYGNAILSKWLFADTQTFYTRGTYKRNFDVTRDDYNVRNLQLATANFKGTPLHILNHHGQFIPGSKSGNDEITTQMHMIAEVIDGLEGAVILCGDFNLTPDSPSMAVINKKLTNLSVEHKLERTYSHLSNIDAVCDYIAVNDSIKVKKFKASEKLVSDHKPLIMEFDL